jgi:hypothetical protein
MEESRIRLGTSKGAAVRLSFTKWFVPQFSQIGGFYHYGPRLLR